MRQLLTISCWLLASSFQLQAQPPAPAPEPCPVGWLRARLWWRETNGYNSGPGIDEAIRANHGQPREEYCGDTQAMAQRSCGLPVPVGSNGSYNWFLDKVRTFYLVGVRGTLDLIKPSHLVGLYSQAKHRICHITRVVQVVPALQRGRPPRGFYCIGGNEGTGASAGMHYTFYFGTSIHAAADWSR